MELLGLKVGDFGDEVARLHEALMISGIDVPAEEVKRKFFGPATREEITRFQKRQGLAPTGELDPETVAAIGVTSSAPPRRPPEKSADASAGATRHGINSPRIAETKSAATGRVVNREGISKTLVDEIGAERFVVRGEVRKADGEPVLRAHVRVFDKGLRRERTLGEGITDAAGLYEIAYNTGAERLSLIVRAFDKTGEELAASTVVFGPKLVETIDVVIGTTLRGPSEYTLLERQLLPHLEGVDPADVTAEEAEHLAKKLDLNLSHLGAYVISSRVAKETRLPPPSLYGFFRQNLPRHLPALLAQDPSVLRRALEHALNTNMIPTTIHKSVDEILDRMRALIVEHAFKKPETDGKYSLNELLSTTRLTRQQQERLLTRYVRHKGNVEVFWEDLGKDPEFGEERVGEAQFALQLGALTNNYLPLVRAIQARGVKTTRELAKLNEADWLDVIRGPLSGGSLVGTPPDVSGGTNEEKQENYAKVLSAIIEDAFPTEVFVRRLEEDADATISSKQELVAFVDNNPDFGFAANNIDKYLKEHPDAMRGASDVDALKKDLKSVKRLFSLVPKQNRYRAIKPLLERGLTSGLSIERMGSGFEKEFAPRMGGAAAQLVYLNAVQRAALAQTVFFHFSPAMLYGTPKAILEGLPAPYPEIPNWETLFGSLDLCACEHCASVHGPAAYLVDILAFVKNQGVSHGFLVPSRRADIADIELSCRNTTTPLPYIDLVNEVLENAIATPGKAYQTEGTAQELRAAAEHRNDDAYEELAKAVYPWNLPFSLPHEEAWRYLEHLGLERYRFMEIFQTEGKDADSASPSAAAIAADHLKLTPADRDIITGDWTGSGPKPTLQQCWGKANVTTDALRSQMGNVETFLRQAGLTYTQLLELISTSFVRSVGTIDIEFETEECDLKKAHIVPPHTADRLGRIHRFERLRRKLGWSFYDLDRAITALQPGELNDALIVNLSDLERLRGQLKVPLVEMLSWWAPIDTTDYPKDHLPKGGTESPSLYGQVFQNKIAFDKETLAVFHLNTSKTELVNTGHDLEANQASIASVLRISANDLAIIAESLSKELNLKNLSQMYRVVSLAKALKLPITQFLSLQTLSGIDPFESPAETRRFSDIVTKIGRSGFSVPLLEYLLWHVETPPLRVAPSDDEIAGVLGELRAGLQKIEQENSLSPEISGESAPDPEGDLTRKKLALLLDGDDLKRTVALISGTVGSRPGDLPAFIKEKLPFLDPEDAVKKLIGQNGNPPELDPKEKQAERFKYVLTPLLEYLRQMLGKALVIQATAAATRVPVRTAELLLTESLASTASDTKPLIDDFLENTFVGSGNTQLTRRVFARQFNAFARLWKATTLVSILRITADELSWIAAHRADLKLLDFNALPLKTHKAARQPVLAPSVHLLLGRLHTAKGEALPVLFPHLERLIDLMQLRDELPSGEPHLFDILDIAPTLKVAFEITNGPEQRFIAKLHENTGWDIETLEILIGKEGLRIKFPEHYRTGYALRRLQACITALRRVGADLQPILLLWIEPRLTADGARNIKAAVKSKYDNTQWLAIAQSINDVLREKQRDALASHLIATRAEFQDLNDLYAHYLIDPEMSACMLTSRIKQAISSVQLYIQRVLLRLEGEDLDLSPKAVEEWKWMKLYRVWEANRKVFLYPENWIEPELRDDKSPFFKELESELLQNELTNDAVETAFKHYLEKLSEVTRLEISGIYTEPNTEIHHVFARTRGIPHIYYYRRWVFPQYWTPWERVALDIEGDHLIPVVFNRRLYLFWPIFREKTLDESPSAPGEAEAPSKFLEIQLAWSECKGDKWLAKKVSTRGLQHRVTSKDDYFVRTVENFSASRGKELIIKFRHGSGKAIIYWNVGYFRFGFAGEPIPFAYSWTNHEETGPARSLYEFNTFREDEEDNHHDALEVPTEFGPTEVLRKTPGLFTIAYPHQYDRFRSQSSFFYQDDTKTFVVKPFVFSLPDQGYTIGLKDAQYMEPDAVGPLFGLFRNHLPFAPSGESSSDVELELLDARSIEDAVELPPVRATRLVDTGVTTVNPLQRGFEGALIDKPLPQYSQALEGKRFSFHIFYHPFVTAFVEKLNSVGIDGLLGNLDLQGESKSFFVDRYGDKDLPAPIPPSVTISYPIEEIAFDQSDAYSLYNWEIFFHAPLLIAERLSKDQRFEEAQRWFHYIFNPTDCSDGSSPQCFWKVRPFHEYDLNSLNSKPIQELMELLSKGSPELENQVAEWRANPFRPHAIARLRTMAYQKTVVMKYLDNLIAWGDQLFRRDTIESINEATQLYVLASEILGPRPTEIPPHLTPPPKTFAELEPVLDEFSNALIEIENAAGPGAWEAGAPGGSLPPLGTILYFCIPKNDKLLGYWDTLADRLFKIRHCMNIEGVVRELPLFEPPIDPALLVQAVAAGIDISSAINDLNAPLPHYRFQIMASKASELCNDVKSLGAALLSALEKRDAEELALLRSTHEINLLEAMRQVREKQIEEARETHAALCDSREVVSSRRKYFDGLANQTVTITEWPISLDARGVNLWEVMQLGMQAFTLPLHLGQIGAEITAGVLNLIPEWKIGAPTAIGLSFGGSNIAGALQSFAASLGTAAAMLNTTASMAGTIGTYVRRLEEWEHQRDQADKELCQVDKQIAAANVRISIVEAELRNHDKQTEQTKEIDAYMRTKYTNSDLYNWMISQISAVYFQSYQLAYDVAKRAERAYRYELGIENSSFIQFGYWDSLKKGLMAGERLAHDLKRMEVAYLDQNRREYEITKHISLAMLDPLALVTLRETGECFVDLPETLFDMDYPGHYLRRLKTVGLTIPCVVGPYTSVNCTLTLLSNSVRRAATPSSPYARTAEGDDPRFADNVGAIQSIATSGAQSDSGLFELNFRDERYLPFEGAGAISRWRIELPIETNQFDRSTISDVVLHLRYTAREGGGALRTAALGSLPMSGVRLFSLRHEFPTEWHRFLHPDPASNEDQRLEIGLSANKFPFRRPGALIRINRVELFGRFTPEDEFAGDYSARLTPVLDEAAEITMSRQAVFGGLHHGVPDLGGQERDPGNWRLRIKRANAPDYRRLPASDLDDVFLVCFYTLNSE